MNFVWAVHIQERHYTTPQSSSDHSSSSLTSGKAASRSVVLQPSSHLSCRLRVVLVPWLCGVSLRGVSSLCRGCAVCRCVVSCPRAVVACRVDACGELSLHCGCAVSCCAV